MRNIDIVDEAYEETYKDSNKEDWSPFNPPRPIFVVWAVVKTQEIIMNGGLQYFFESDWPGQPAYSLFVEAFREAGAIQAANHLQEAVDDFPFPNPHESYQKRRVHFEASRSKPDKYDSVIDRLGAEMTDSCDETYEKLERYIRSNLRYFPDLQAKLNASPIAMEE